MSFIDTTSVYLHVLAAIGLVGGGIVQVMAGRRLLGATGSDDIARWATFARSAGPLLIGSAVLSLVTGGHLAGAVWTTESTSGFSYPWITLGAVALVVLAPIGPMVGGTRLRRLAEWAREGETITTHQLSDPVLWGSVFSLPGVGVALVWAMVTKPTSWPLTGAILIIGFGLGWAIGVGVARRAT